VKTIGPRDAEALLAAGGLDLVDVREPREWASGHLPGARLVPLDTLRADPRAALPRDRVLLVCARGGRSLSAAKVADQLGLTEVYSLEGGTEEWVKTGLPLEVPAPAPRASGPAPAPAAPPPADEERLGPALDAVIGANLRELRSRRGLSLDATARLTGLSRAQLGQIELGLHTPSVSVVWKIARAFEVPFAALLAAPGPVATALLRGASAKRLISADGRFSSRALFPFGESTKVEFYELWLAAHGREDAEAHAPGTRENLIVTAGRLELEVGGVRHQLEKGDAIVFGADVPHAYVNPGNEECWMYLVMTYASAPGA
jgi:rhodanese-related sulfurtransferase/transcriptional regulator with XRE-family HTH domain